jgi:nitrogen fixation protein FixH
MMQQTERPFTGRHMLMTMLTFFGVIIVVNMTMVYFATHSWTGLVVKNSYVASQEFNAKTERLERTSAHVHSKIQYKAKRLSISFLDAAGQALAATSVTMTLGRPSHEGEDRVITFTSAENGIYEAKLELGRGQWLGQVSGDFVGHGQWQRPVRLLVEE